MKQSSVSRSTTLLRSAVLGLGLTVAGFSQAASLTFQAPVVITNTSVLDTPLSFTNAALLQAINFGSGTGSGAQSVVTAQQTINFTAGTTSLSGPSGTGTALFNTGTQGGVVITSSGNTQFDNVLKSDGWHSTGSELTPLTLQLGGLTIGQTYVVSIFSADNRGSSAGRTQQYYDTFSGGVFSGGSSTSFSQNPSTAVLATFTADATTQSIFVSATTGGGATDTTISGFTLYSFTPVPEPSEYGIVLGGLLLVVIAFRRRRNMVNQAI